MLFIALTVTFLYVCFCFSVFIALCIVFLTAGVPFNPKSLAFAAWVSKLRHARAKHVQKKK